MKYLIIGSGRMAIGKRYKKWSGKISLVSNDRS
jgi:hypothetical protein